MVSAEGFGKGLLILRVMWAGMFTSLALYLFIALQLGASAQASMDKGTFAVLRPVLYIAAFVILIVTRYIKRSYISSKKQYRQAIQYFRQPVLQNYATALIVAWALSESIGISGLALFFLGKNPTDLYLLILVSAAAMLAYRPRKADVIRLSQQNGEASKTGGEIGDSIKPIR